MESFYEEKEIKTSVIRKLRIELEMRKKDNVDLICDISELSTIFDKTSRLDDFLQTVVEMVAHHMRATVCSVYLYEAVSKELILSATIGLSHESIRQVKLKSGEGIVGTAMEELRPILENVGSENPHFKYIPGTGEEQYQAFLAVPLLRGLEKIGVITLQHANPGYFNQNDLKAIRAIAAQLAATIENAQLFISLHEQAKQTEESENRKAEPLKLVRGASASSGIAVGKITKIFESAESRFDGSEADVKEEYSLKDFYRALKKTEEQLSGLQQKMEQEQYDVASLIFSSHLLIIKDSQFSGVMAEKIQAGWTPTQAVVSVVNKYVDIFSKSPNPRLAEKVQDIKDLGHRILLNLKEDDAETADYSGHIVLCGELLPSDLLKLVAQKAAGIIIVGAAMTAHLSILSKSLEIPIVFTNETQLYTIPENEEILLEGNQGLIYIKPSEEVREKYTSLQETSKYVLFESKAIPEQTYTKDQTQIHLLANINLLSELPLVHQLKAEGIGLYRSEFPFIIRNTFPSEEEQYRIYRRILQNSGDKEVTFRTLDVGGDKMLSYYSHVNEANPFLGLRALRFSLRNQDIFAQQLRAMLRAGHGYELKIMFPLVSSVDDFLQARTIVSDCIRQLETEEIEHNAHPQIGVMIELPSAAEITTALAKYSDFVCIGTNDLIQYVLGVDRTNEAIADLYLAYHPAVLRILHKIVKAVQAQNKKITLCGELATDSKLLPFLLGIGLRRLSINPKQLPDIQAKISAIHLEDAQELAQAILEMDQIKEIEKKLGYRA